MRDNQTFPVKAVWPNSAEFGLGVRLAVPESTSNRDLPLESHNYPGPTTILKLMAGVGGNGMY